MRNALIDTVRCLNDDILSIERETSLLLNLLWEFYFVNQDNPYL